MTRSLLLIILTLALGCTSSLVATPAAAQSNVHIVLPGETLFSIAQRYGTTVTELRMMNNLRSETVREGQRLIVRRWAETYEPPDIEELERYDTGPSSLGQRPPDLVAPEPIPTGPPPPPPPPADIERIRLSPGAAQPVPSAQPTRVATHRVASGETLFSIAQRYGTTVDAIRQANAITGDLISVGQELAIPGATGASRPTVQTQRPGRYDVNRSTLPDDENHVVLPGETLYAIADRYGVTAGDLIALNSLTTAPLTPGKVLALPEEARRHYREPAPPRIDQEGLVLVYPPSYVGRMTISGEPYDPAALTASHRELPFGTMLRVIEPESGRQTLVRVNDRGPVSEGFLLELSQAAADRLGLRAGSAHHVQVQVLR